MRVEITDKGVYLMGSNDVQDVASIHLEAFQGFFLTFLGAKFLSELYSSTLNDSFGNCICIIDLKVEFLALWLGLTKTSRFLSAPIAPSVVAVWSCFDHPFYKTTWNITEDIECVTGSTPIPSPRKLRDLDVDCGCQGHRG